MAFTSYMTVVFLYPVRALLSTATLLQSLLWAEFSNHSLTFHCFT